MGVYVLQVGSFLAAYTFLLTRSRRLSVVAILFLMLWFLVSNGPVHLPAAIVAAAGSAEELNVRLDPKRTVRARSPRARK